MSAANGGHMISGGESTRVRNKRARIGRGSTPATVPAHRKQEHRPVLVRYIYVIFLVYKQIKGALYPRGVVARCGPQSVAHAVGGEQRLGAQRVEHAPGDPALRRAVGISCSSRTWQYSTISTRLPPMSSMTTASYPEPLSRRLLAQ